MTGTPLSDRARTRRLPIVMATAAVAAMVVGIPVPAGADVGSVSGSATGYRSSVSLFGGPAGQRGPVGTPGCDPNQPAPGGNSSRTEGCSPTVVLPANGSAPVALTDTDGARAVYGPAVVFGGLGPFDDSVAPPSGPITVRTEGSTGPNRSVTSSASINRAPGGSTWLPSSGGRPQPWLGGVGPGPLLVDAVSSQCTAAETNPATGATAVTGSTTLTNGRLGLNTDQYGRPLQIEPMPTNPIPNDGPHRGVLTNVGDSYEVFYNEQDRSVPGSITVTAIHMRLLGPTAVGDLYIGVSQCGVVTRPATTPSGSGICTALTRNHQRVLAWLDAARTMLPQSGSPGQQAAVLAALERLRTQAAALADRMRAAGCRIQAT